MLEALIAALAELAALEARAQELVDPITSISNAVKAVVKEGALVISALAAKVGNLEAQLAAVTAHPALWIPAIGEETNAGTSAAPTAAATTEAEAPGPSSEADAVPVPAPDVPGATLGGTLIGRAMAEKSDPAAGAPDVSRIFGFDDTTRSAP